MAWITRTAMSALVIGTLAAGTAGAAPVPTIEHGLILDGVTVVDTRDGALAYDMAVVIEDGKILKVVRAGTIAAAGAARSVDAHGKFVVPGYLDMHVHVFDAGDAASNLTMMLANGVTGFRQMSGSIEMLEQRRQGTLLPPGPAPELLAMPGDLIVGPNAATPEIVVAEIRRQKAAGADFIKMIDARPDVFFAALEEAKRLGLPMVGHLPLTVDVHDASRAGMRAMEHYGARDSVLIGCSADEAAIRQAIAQSPPPPPPAGPPPQAVLERAHANPNMFSKPAEFARYQHVIDTFSETKCRRLASLFLTEATWQVPTLIRLRTMDFGNAPAYRDDPELRYVPANTRRIWREVGQDFAARIAPADRHSLENFFALQMRLTKLFERSGVRMMAGSDLGGQWVIAGHALHQELDLLAESGLSPIEILQMTTLNGAKFLGRQATMGTVRDGRHADLVILDANPIESVRNMHKIAGVVRAGTYYSAADLAAMKEKLAARLASPAPAAP